MSTDLLTYPWQHWVAGGPLLVPIALVCFALWAFFLDLRSLLTRTLRESGPLERSLADGCVDAPAEGGPLAAAVARATRSVRNGARPSEAFAREERIEMSRLRRNIVILAALTAVAPLLGLLGTVVGMIETFDAVAVAGGGTAERVAAGISKALITTQFGLAVAIPGIFALARIRRLVDHVALRFSLVRVLAVAAMESRPREVLP